MERLVVKGENELVGTVNISGAKNAACPIIAGSLLANERVIIRNVPKVLDVSILEEMIRSLGAEIEMRKGNMIEVNPDTVTSTNVTQDHSRLSRVSILLLGSLLAKFGRARIPYPRGNKIGARRIDIHVRSLRAMGAKMHVYNGYIEARADDLRGVNLNLDFPTVSGTLNIMTTASLARGTTSIRNPAKEPEIVNMANFLNKMGARVHGAGTDLIEIEGVRNLGGCECYVIPDRIEAGTYMVAAAITHGDVLIKNIISDHVKALKEKLKDSGVAISESNGIIRVKTNEEIRAVNINTMPYPGFPTDLQPPMMSLMTLAKGVSMIRETIFENRFHHALELKKMGADIKIKGDVATVTGVKKLHGTYVVASDIRAGAAILLAGLAAEKITEIGNVVQLDRGYEHLERKLKNLGADIERLAD